MRNISKFIEVVLLISIIVFCYDISLSDNEVEFKKLYQSDITANKIKLQTSNQCQSQCENPQVECQHVEYFNTPAYQDGIGMNMPESVKDKFIEMIFNNQNIKNNIETIYSVPDNNSGDLKFKDNKTLNYLFSEDLNFRNGIYYTSPYQNGTIISDFDKQIFINIISLSGQDNSQIFLKELLASQPINHCSACVIRQKKSKYGMVELSFCDEDKVTVFTLYKSPT